MPEQHSDEEPAGAEPRHTGRSRPLAEGAHFAAYVIEGLLGSGGLTRVYRGRHATLGHAVALKVFEPSAAVGPAGIARFFHEAQLAATIRHPHVVRTFDAGVHESYPFLVMEALEGRDLEARLRSERALEELALIELAIPIVAGLMALHARDLVHGDLGPGNVFLLSSPQQPDTPKLLDIGISKPHRGLRLTAAARQRLMGSPLYMAPEAMLGRQLGPASDQYSLGVILYECVTGVNPFVSTSLNESVRLIISGTRLPVLEQSTAPSPGLASIIERASSVAPEERFPDLASMGRALLRLADQRTRATWEFSFQPGAKSLAGVARAALGNSGNARWKAAALVLGALGWAIGGVVALQAAQREAGDQYVLLGAVPSRADTLEQRQFELHASNALPAQAPCAPRAGTVTDGVSHPTDSAASAVEAASSAEVHAPASPAPALLPPERATPPEPVMRSELETSPESTTPAELAAPAELDQGAASLPADAPREPTAPQEPISHLIPRGTNNAPIFD
ncbi:MAG: protein kinase [Deltaproteobacteria bacterium]